MPGPRIIDSGIRDDWGLARRFYAGLITPFPATALYTVPSTARAMVYQIMIVNITNLPSTFTLYEPDSSTPMFAAVTIPGNTTYIYDAFIPLNPSEGIFGYTGIVNSIVVHVFGFERNIGS